MLDAIFTKPHMERLCDCRQGAKCNRCMAEEVRGLGDAIARLQQALDAAEAALAARKASEAAMPPPPPPFNPYI